MENSKSAKICAYLSLAISVVLMVLWSCNVGGFEAVNLDTFVGVIVALLAIIVTLAVAWQIYNVIDIKNKIEDLKQLEDNFKKQENSLTQLSISTSARMNRLAGMTAIQGRAMVYAFKYMLGALVLEMQLEKPDNVDYLLRMLELSVKKINPGTKHDRDDYEVVIKLDKEIRSLDNYNLIKGRYEPIYKEFMSKVEKADESK